MTDVEWGDRPLPTVSVPDHAVPEGGLRLTFDPTPDDARFTHETSNGEQVLVYVRPSKYEGMFEVFMAHTIWGPADHTPADLVRTYESLSNEFPGIENVLDEVLGTARIQA